MLNSSVAFFLAFITEITSVLATACYEIYVQPVAQLVIACDGTYFATVSLGETDKS